MADAELDQLLRRPALVAAVRDLGIVSLSLEDVLTALRSFGAVRIVVDHDPARPYVCQLEAGDEHVRTRADSVLHAALACWAEALEGVDQYTQQGVAELERFLLGP